MDGNHLVIDFLFLTLKIFPKPLLSSVRICCVKINNVQMSNNVENTVAPLDDLGIRLNNNKKRSKKKSVLDVIHSLNKASMKTEAQLTMVTNG